MISLVYPKNGAVLSIMSPAFHDYIRRQREGLLDKGPYDEGVNDFLPEGESSDFFNSSKENLSHPAKLYFRWTSDSPERLLDLQISTDESFDNPVTYLNCERIFSMIGEGNTYCCPVSNFETGRKYYWRVVNDGGELSETRFFETPADEIRSIYIEGGSNIRDIGGRRTLDGKYIRQGVIYRGVEIEDDEIRDHRLTDEGRKTFYGELGIKTDLDLREEALGRRTRHGYWGGVRHLIKPSYTWDNTFEGTGAAWMKEVMDVVLDPKYYPVYFHCYAGADRTGTLGAYLELLLDLPLESVKLDFNITSLSCIDKRNWELHGYRDNTLNILAGKYPEEETLSGRIKAYLTDLGIKKSKIESFVEYMKVDK